MANSHLSCGFNFNFLSRIKSRSLLIIFCEIIVLFLIHSSCSQLGIESNINDYHSFDRGNACPKICSCLGNLISCSQHKLTDVPSDIPHWTGTYFALLIFLNLFYVIICLILTKILSIKL